MYLNSFWNLETIFAEMSFFSVVFTVYPKCTFSNWKIKHTVEKKTLFLHGYLWWKYVLIDFFIMGIGVNDKFKTILPPRRRWVSSLVFIYLPRICYNLSRVAVTAYALSNIASHFCFVIFISSLFGLNIPLLQCGAF